jgi:hypothetical protein
MGLFKKIGSLFGFGQENVANKRGSSNLKNDSLDSFDFQKQFKDQRTAQETARDRDQRAERYLPGFFSSYAAWAAERTRLKLRGRLPKNAPDDVGTFEKERRAEKLKIQTRLLLDSVPRGRGKTGTSSQRANTPLSQFLAGEFVEVSSSNVSRIAFDGTKNGGTLKVIFLDENEYHYMPIHPGFAEAFFNAGSKGGWVWDNLRIRGTALGHKVSYMHVKGHGEIQRKWIQTDDLIVGHHAQVESESTAYKGKDRIIAMIPGNLILDD